MEAKTYNKKYASNNVTIGVRSIRKNITGVKEQAIARIEVDKANKANLKTKTHNIVATKAKKENRVVGQEDKIEEAKLYRDELVKRAHDNYTDWMRLTTEPFTETRFHLFLCALMQTIMEKAERGYDQRVLIATPPRAGKSTTIPRRMPSYWLGRHPDVETMTLSADVELASDFGDNNRMCASLYWQEVFGISISDAFRSKYAVGVNENKGIMRFRGVTSANVGKGGNLIIVDDPYPDEEYVNNPTQRKRLISTIQNDIFSRSERKKYDNGHELGSIIIIIHTRRHEDDLIGTMDNVYIKAEESPNGIAFKRWVNVTIPAIADSENDPLGRKKGEPLMPEMGFNWTLPGLLMKKAEIGLRAFNCQFQQNPMADGGNYIQKEWLENSYDKKELPIMLEDVVLSCDLSNNSKSTSDFSAFQVWGRSGNIHYLLMRGKARRTFNGQIEIIRQFIQKMIAFGYPIQKVLIEERATGTAAIDVLKKELPGIAVIGFDVGYTDKIMRINTVSPIFEGGLIRLPTEKNDPTIEEYKQTMMLFPSVSHDDEVDATSQYLIYYIKNVKQKYGKIVSSEEIQGLTNFVNLFRGRRKYD